MKEVTLGYTEAMTPARKRLTREESRAQTREHLLEAAQTLFAQKGFEATSVEEVAEHAGYSRGALYGNYAGKEELLVALIERCFERDIAQVLEVLETVTDVRERHGRILEGFFHAELPKSELLLQHEFRACGLRYESVRSVYARELERLHAAIGALIERHARDLGLALPLPGVALASTLTAVRHGILTQHDLTPQAVPADLYAAVFYRVLGADLERWDFAEQTSDIGHPTSEPT